MPYHQVNRKRACTAVRSRPLVSHPMSLRCVVWHLTTLCGLVREPGSTQRWVARIRAGSVWQSDYPRRGGSPPPNSDCRGERDQHVEIANASRSGSWMLRTQVSRYVVCAELESCMVIPLHDGGSASRSGGDVFLYDGWYTGQVRFGRLHFPTSQTIPDKEHIASYTERVGMTACILA